MPLITYSTPGEDTAPAVCEEFALLSLRALRTERAVSALRSKLDEFAPATPANTKAVHLRLSLTGKPTDCTAEAIALVLLWMHTEGHCDRDMASSFKAGLSLYYEKMAYVPL